MIFGHEHQETARLSELTNVGVELFDKKVTASIEVMKGDPYHI